MKVVEYRTGPASVLRREAESGQKLPLAVGESGRSMFAFTGGSRPGVRITSQAPYDSLQNDLSRARAANNQTTLPVSAKSISKLVAATDSFPHATKTAIATRIEPTRGIPEACL